MQLIVHAPLGARVNRALGLGLRKKFCLNFDFELQAAASNDAALLSLGPQHSFPLEDVPAFLRSHNVQDAVSQAVLRSPMFTARWRWNLNRSLAVLRRKGGRLNPFNIQRMEADDLMAAVFPDLAACQDNAPAGPDRDPRSPARAGDDGRLPQRGHGHRRPQGARAPVRAGHRSPPLRRHRRAQRAGPRDPQRRPVHLPRRGHRDRRAPVAGGAAAPRPAGGASRAGPARPGRDRAGAGRGDPGGARRRRAPRRAPVPRRRPAAGGVGGAFRNPGERRAGAFEVHGPADRRPVGGDRAPGRGRGALPRRPVRARSPASARPGRRCSTRRPPTRRR